jgi:hypothetical protein
MHLSMHHEFSCKSIIGQKPANGSHLVSWTLLSWVCAGVFLITFSGSDMSAERRREKAACHGRAWAFLFWQSGPGAFPDRKDRTVDRILRLQGCTRRCLNSVRCRCKSQLSNILGIQPESPSSSDITPCHESGLWSPSLPTPRPLCFWHTPLTSSYKTASGTPPFSKLPGACRLDSEFRPSGFMSSKIC